MSGSPKLTGSGSIQSHLSTASSRLRISSSITGLAAKERDDDDVLPHPAHSSDSESTKIPKLSTLLLRFTSTEIPHPGVSPRSRASQWAILSIKIFVGLYCVFSLFFAPYKIYNNIRTDKHRDGDVGHVEQDALQFSPLSSLSDALKLSRVLSYQPETKTLEVGVIHNQALTNHSVTLCLWLDESELLSNVSRVMQLGTQWKGPISLVVTSNSEATATVLQRSIQVLKDQSIALSLHILRLRTPLGSHSPNALLNLARLLSSTPRVLLLPGGLTSTVSHELREALATQHDNTVPFVVVHPSTKVSFPLPQLAPLLVPRVFPSWCTERFFYFTDRAKTWDECLWYLWLESDGKLRAIRTITNDETIPDPPQSDIERKISTRLVLNFRTEMCELRVKRLAASEKHITKKLQKRIDWVNHFCRQVRKFL
ncbi:hypothetical protein V5O48_017842 [Marasmius crinis-equi]|uniref:Glycosyltransferase n=1 Tax=Marasmius crinis-equi TaxID=585013 RepID=A0ABR3EMT9_9AGAR